MFGHVGVLTHPVLEDVDVHGASERLLTGPSRLEVTAGLDGVETDRSDC